MHCFKTTVIKQSVRTHSSDTLSRCGVWPLQLKNPPLTLAVTILLFPLSSSHFAQQMMETMSCEKLREHLRALFPYPCTSRYTAITMMPRPPGLLGSLAFKWMTASSTTKAAVGAATLAVLAAGVTAAVVYKRRAAK